MKKTCLFAIAAIISLFSNAETWRDPVSKVAYQYSPDGTTAKVQAGTKYSTPQNYAIMNTSITIPDHITVDGKDYEVTEIGNFAFNSFIMTKEFVLPNTIKIIGESAFQNCAVEALDIPSSVTTLGIAAFQQSGLKEVTIPETITILPDRVFAYCGSLEAVTIHNTVTEIGAQALYGTGLKEVHIPASVRSIQPTSFSNNKSIATITVAENNAYYDSREDCNAIIETVTNKLVKGCVNTVIPADITVIGVDAFESVEGLKDITLPDGLKELQSMAFNSCLELENVNLPEGLTTIGMQAFYRTSLKSINIPSTVTSIGRFAFGNCNSLENVFSAIEEPFAINEDVFSVYETATLRIPVGTMSKYENTFSWSKFLNKEELTEVSVQAIDTNSHKACPAYDLLGRRVTGMSKSGIRIVNGRITK